MLPNDTANVFITPNARSLNRTIEIIARGEAVFTEAPREKARAGRPTF